MDNLLALRACTMVNEATANTATKTGTTTTATKLLLMLVLLMLLYLHKISGIIEEAKPEKVHWQRQSLPEKCFILRAVGVLEFLGLLELLR